VLSEPEEAKTSAVAQANPFRPRYALVVVSLPDELKPDTVREATSICSGRATRGGRGQRASTDQSRNLRDPTRRDLSGAWSRRNRRRESITAVGLGRESEGAIVARMRGNSRGAKGPCRIDAFVRGEEYRLGQPDYGINALSRDGGWNTGRVGRPRTRCPFLGVDLCPCMPVFETIR
jgi:hypothetical protein